MLTQKNLYFLCTICIGSMCINPQTLFSQEPPQGVYVGSLEERWQFPSDHLPIGISYQGIHFSSWNVLSSDYIHWILEENSQGLCSSLIGKTHLPTDYEWTLRDEKVMEILLQMLLHPTHPRSLICLQECSTSFKKLLTKSLPPSFRFISSQGEAVVFDPEIFDIIQEQAPQGIFPHKPEKSFQNLLLRFKHSNASFRLFNVHLPGDPKQPSVQIFIDYLKNDVAISTPILCMGDMNVDERQMQQTLDLIFPEGSPFTLEAPYCTNISPYTKCSKAIDHVLIFGLKPCSPLLPEQVCEGLEKWVSLLQMQSNLHD